MVLMAMMALFALISFEERTLVLLPGNLAVAGGLGGGALALGLQRRGWFGLALCGALVAFGLGVAAQAGVSDRWMRLPGRMPIIWIVTGLYVAFRLSLVRQRVARLAQDRDLQARRRNLATPAEGDPVATSQPDVSSPAGPPA